jgi:hypothetical protein
MHTQWTRESIIRHLLEREAKGLPLSVGGQGVGLSLYGAARRIFGSWRNAIKAAGIAPQQVLTWERWSPARILVMIRHLARRRRPLTTDQLERRYHNLVTAARRHFGSWSKAVLAAGVKPTKLQRVVPWNQERVIEAILRRALRNESLVARLVEPRSLLDAAQRFYGSWTAAVAAAGLDSGLTVPPPGGKRRRPAKAHAPDRREDEICRVPWTKERVIAQLLARDREQKPMHSTALARDENRLYHAARRHLGSWSEAMRAAGLDPELYRRGPENQSSSIETKSHPPGPAQSQSAEIMRPNHTA